MLIPKIYPVTSHTDHVGQGSTFVVIRGFKIDGATYIAQAINRGASAIVIEDKTLTPELEQLCSMHNIKLDVVCNARQELAKRAAQALGNPAAQLTMIGVTGTKGKSTTTYLVEHILRTAGLLTGLVGTIKNFIATYDTTLNTPIIKEMQGTHTTPESDALQMFLAQAVQHQVSHVVLETSSHALSLNRVDGILFDVVGFTNLYHDHMDFYTSMEHYFTDKLKLFDQVKPGGSIVINTDNEWGLKALARAIQLPNVTVITCGQQSLIPDVNNHRHVQFSVLDSMSLSIALEPDAPGVSRKIITCAALIGDFNGYNLVMAWLIAFKMGIKPDIIQHALDLFSGVPGRMQLHRLKNGALGIVDYAHNAASMDAVLKLLRTMTKNLIVVFGCGGDRDPSRRPAMGAVAAQYADQIILTNDNPRSEDGITIIHNILAGIPASQHEIVSCQPDRSLAIQYAAELAQPEAIIAILGKGHENYYIVGDAVLYFDDYQEIQQF
jgi:UDP-N-acetylmuramoyl-L-alanyl-D-glutamate--2,6-diaminopimelate ligase